MFEAQILFLNSVQNLPSGPWSRTMRLQSRDFWSQVFHHYLEFSSVILLQKSGWSLFKTEESCSLVPFLPVIRHFLLRHLLAESSYLIGFRVQSKKHSFISESRSLLFLLLRSILPMLPSTTNLEYSQQVEVDVQDSYHLVLSLNPVLLVLPLTQLPSILPQDQLSIVLRLKSAVAFFQIFHHDQPLVMAVHRPFLL